MLIPVILLVFGLQCPETKLLPELMKLLTLKDPENFFLNLL
jgi:hypothetical protein